MSRNPRATTVAAILTAAILMVVPANAAIFFTNFHKTYDPMADNGVTEIKQTADLGYVIIGGRTVNSVPIPGPRPMVIKLNANFAVQWNTTYVFPSEFPNGFLGAVYASDIFQTSDGGYIVCGKHVEEFVADGAFLLRLDPFGDVIWYNIYPNIYGLSSVIEINSQITGALGFMACGDSYPAGSPQTPTILMTDGNGAVQWVRHVLAVNLGAVYPGDYRQVIPYSFGPAGDTAALVGNVNAYITSCNSSHADVLVTVCDTLGNLSLNNVYGQGVVGLPGSQYSTYEIGNSIARDHVNDDLVIVGSAASFSMDVCAPSAYEDIFAFKIDPGGTVLWSNQYDVQSSGGHQEAGIKVDVSSASDRHIVLTGWANTNFLSSTYSHDVAMLSLASPAGGVTSSWCYGGSNSEHGTSIVENNFGYPVILANTYSFHPTQNLVYLIEHYWSHLKNCNDKPMPVAVVPHPLPINPPIDRYDNTPVLNVPLVAIDPTLGERVWCNKVPVTISNGPKGGNGSGGGAPWNP